MGLGPDLKNPSTCCMTEGFFFFIEEFRFYSEAKKMVSDIMIVSSVDKVFCNGLSE